MIISGFDLDGVLCKNVKWGEDTLLKEKKLLRPTFFKCTPKLRNTSGDKIYIVTSRKEQYRSNTEEWLKRNKIKYDRLFMLKEARTRRNIIDFKHRTIVENKIDTFYEDDEKISRVLQKRLPTVKVVTVINQEPEMTKEEVKRSFQSCSKLF